MRRIYRVAVIGHTGRGNYGHGIDTVWNAIDGCQVVAVADPDPAGREGAMRRLGAEDSFADYEKMLDDVEPDIVSICPRWIDQHHAMSMAAIERGIHVYSEKPFCRTPAEGESIVAACDRNNVKFAIAFQTRYSPILQIVRDLIYDGRIGDLLEIRMRGKEDHRGGGEDLWVLGSHLMNLAYYFAGEPEWCFSQVSYEGKQITKDDAIEGNEGLGKIAGDRIHAMYGMNSEVIAYFESVRSSAGGRFGLRLLGSKGAIDLTTGYVPSAALLEDATWSPGRSGKQWIPITSAGVGEPEPIKERGLDAGNVAACQDLLDAIQNDRDPEASAREGLTTVEMICAVFASAVQQKRIAMPLENRGNPFE